jgi:hypothetical protein
MKLASPLLLFVSFSLLAGCAKDNPPAQNNQEHVSTIPWNRPEKWEGTGALGGMVPSSQ